MDKRLGGDRKLTRKHRHTVMQIYCRLVDE